MNAEIHQEPVERGLVKVTFVLPKSDWHTHGRETLWAVPAGNGTFRIRNVPFFVYGVGYDDAVVASEKVGELLFESVREGHGHSTYRIFVTTTAKLELFDRYWSPLEQVGCTFERATERLFAVDVRPEANIHRAYDALRAGEDVGVWDFEEAHVGHSVT